MIDKKEICIIECVFGKHYSHINSAPVGYDAYFFSNNEKIKKQVVKQGWNFIFVDFPLSSNIAVSSLQSKWVKFLQFLKNKDFNYLKDYTYILYVDHKYLLLPEHINTFLTFAKKPIVVRNYWNNKRNLWEEIYGAMQQERYLMYMPQTIEWVRDKARQGYDDNPKVFLTGLILYKINDVNEKLWNFLEETYNTLVTIGTSECQIIFPMLAQNYADSIQIIDYESLSIEHYTPRSAHINILKKITPYFILRKWRNWKSSRSIKSN